MNAANWTRRLILIIPLPDLCLGSGFLFSTQHEGGIPVSDKTRMVRAPPNTRAS